MNAKQLFVVAPLLVFFLWIPLLAGAQDRHGEHHNQPAAGNVHQGKGTVHSVDLETATVRMEHEPIPSLRWPKMVMDLKAEESGMLEGLQEGDRIEFDLIQSKQGFVITRIERK